MKNNIKFPKISKHIKNFLTDESGKITKHNALGVGAIGALLGSTDGVDAHHCTGYNGGGSAGNFTNTWTSNITGSANPENDNMTFLRGNGACGHGSGILNGSFVHNFAEVAGAPATHSSGGNHYWSSPIITNPNVPEPGCENKNSTSLGGNSVNTMFVNCGEDSGTVRGHFSGYPTGERVTHSNGHANY